MYTIWKIPKRRQGEFRIIESPDDILKQKQKDDLKLLQKELKVSPFAHAFQPYRNIVTMAMPHVKKKWILSFDIKDFFPSITLNNFIKVIPKFIIPRGSIHFHDFNDGKGTRLPQGAPGSPFLSNVYLHKFDWRIAWKCYSHGCDFNRYADDITISGENKRDLIAVYAYAASILEHDYDLKINKKKTKYMPNWKRQMVCGIIVNEKLNLPRKWRKNLRAEIFQNRHNILSNKTEGKLSFNDMVLDNKKQSFTSSDIILSCSITKRMKKGR